jgi:sugar/nucleoside kinase (ribokinase family)
MPTICLGEALVDLVCEQPVASLEEARSFTAHFGGATANVAVAAARLGAPVALAGGAGADAWGRWLLARLDAEGVDVEHFGLVDGAPTAVAFVTSDARGEPDFTVYGDGIPAAMASLEPRLEAAMAGAVGLFFGSNTLVGESERELTMRARAIALDAGLPVIFDPNFRLGRWRLHSDALAAASACVPDALMVKCNLAEAELLTGERDPHLAATALCKAGARMAVVTLGERGAVLRGSHRADIPGVPARVVSTVGAGDTLAGVLLARLALSDWYEPSVPAALREAVEAAARATERWSALD